MLQCSGHGRCVAVPIQPLYKCSAGNKCIAQPADGRADNGVPQAECEAACGGAVDSKLYRCVNGTCVATVSGVSAGECAKMCDNR